MNNNELRMPSYDLTGKVAIVTGGTKGIGHAIAVTLANFGADVVVSSRTAADCEKIQKEIEAMGRRCLGIACNVGVEGDVENSILLRGVRVEKGAKISGCILMQDTVIRTGAHLKCAIADEHVTVTEGRTLMGHTSYPMAISKFNVVWIGICAAALA